MTTPRVSVITTTLSLSNPKKREWNALMEFIGEKHGISRAWWPAHRTQFDGRAHLMTYAMQSIPTVEKVATVLANNSDYTYEQIEPNISLLDFTGDTPEDRLAAAQAWLYDLARVDDWEFDEQPAWMIEPEPDLPEEPEEPPEGWPVSIPLEWIEIEEPE